MTTLPQRYRRTTDWRTTYCSNIERSAGSARAAKPHDVTNTKCLQVQLILWFLMVFTIRLGQGLGSWNVSVSSRTLNASVSSRTKCPTSRSRTYASRVSSRSRPERSRAHPCRKVVLERSSFIFLGYKLNHGLQNHQLAICFDLL